MSHLPHARAGLIVVSLLLAAGGCGRKPIAGETGTAGAAAGGGGRGGAAGSAGGATAGNGGGPAGGNAGGASAGSTGGGAAGSTGGGTAGAGGRGGGAGSTGGAIAGAGGGAVAGASGGAVAGASGGGPAGAGGSPVGGTGGGAAGGTGGSATGGSGGGLGPIRLVIFYTRWGTNYPDWFPTGSDRNFAMRPLLQPLEPYKGELMVISGLTNANVYTDIPGMELRAANSNQPGDSMLVLLTGRPATPNFPATGPSLDTAVGNCGGAAGEPLRLAVGQFGFNDSPGVSFAANGAAILGERDPRLVAMRVLGHTVTAPDPGGDINAIYPALGAAHMDVAVEALATAKTCAVTLMWGDHVTPQWLNLSGDAHSLSHLAPNLYAAVAVANPTFDPNNQYVRLQTWYAQQFASLLERMRAVPVGAGTLLDRSVVVWISDSGTGSDHQGLFIPVVIAGRGGGRLDVGRFLEIRTRPVPANELPIVGRTQGDLLAALASLWGISAFGDPLIARQPLTEILRP
jgi:hypothetical protein